MAAGWRTRFLLSRIPLVHDVFPLILSHYAISLLDDEMEDIEQQIETIGYEFCFMDFQKQVGKFVKSLFGLEFKYLWPMEYEEDACEEEGRLRVIVHLPRPGWNSMFE